MNVYAFAPLICASCMLLAAISAFTVGVKNIKRLGNIKLILILPLLEILFCLALALTTILLRTGIVTNNESHTTYRNLTYLYSESFNILEFIIISAFINKNLTHRKFQLLHKGLSLIVGIFLLWYLLRPNIDSKILSSSYAVSAVALTFGLMAFFISVVRDDTYIFYQTDPNFLIASGFFIQFSTSFPTLLLLQHLNYSESRLSNYSQAINYAAYTCYFYFIYKGFICQIEQTN